MNTKPGLQSQNFHFSESKMCVKHTYLHSKQTCVSSVSHVYQHFRANVARTWPAAATINDTNRSTFSNGPSPPTVYKPVPTRRRPYVSRQRTQSHTHDDQIRIPSACTFECCVLRRSQTPQDTRPLRGSRPAHHPHASLPLPMAVEPAHQSGGCLGCRREPGRAANNVD